MEIQCRVLLLAGAGRSRPWAFALTAMAVIMFLAPAAARSNPNAGDSPRACLPTLSSQQWDRRHALRGDVLRFLYEELGGVRDLFGCAPLRARRRELPKGVDPRHPRAPYLYGLLR